MNRLERPGKRNVERCSSKSRTERVSQGGYQKQNIGEGRRRFLRNAALVGGGTLGALSLGGKGLVKYPEALNAGSPGYSWEEDSKGRYGLYDAAGTEILSVDNRGQLALFYPYSRAGSGSDIRIDYSNSLFGSGIPRVAFAMKWGKVISSQSFSVTSPTDWIVVYLVVGHLKITGFSGTNPVTITVNYTDPPGHNFTATLCSVTPSETVQNTDFSPICEDIRVDSEITIAINLGQGDSVANMQGYLTFIELDRRPGGDFNPNVPKGMDPGDANQQLMGFSIGEWDGQLK